MNGNPDSWQAAWLAGPALGLTREDQEAWQRLMQRTARVAEAQAGLATSWSGILGKAEGTLRERVAERAAAGHPVTSLRALYDLWVEVAEAEYGESAPGDAYAQQLADFANALSELRIAQRELLERGARSVDLPTRTELDTVHRRLRDLTRSVRALESRLPPAAPVTAARAAPKPKIKYTPRPKPTPTPRSKPTPKSKSKSKSESASKKPRQNPATAAGPRTARPRRDRP